MFSKGIEEILIEAKYILYLKCKSKSNSNLIL